MFYPKQVHVCGHNIDVAIQNTPIASGEMIQNQDGTFQQAMYLGRYDPSNLEIRIYHNSDKPSVGECNFMHEVIEAIDCHADLKLDHTQISTLSSMLYQVWKDMPMAA